MVSKWFMAGAAVVLLAGEARAVPDVVVEGVRMPAWVVRDTTREPLAPGATLQAKDAVATAPGARVLLRLGDGSLIKLGENARFVVGSAGPAPEEAGLFRATLQVLAGAFRFTTTTLAKVRSRRDIRIDLPTVTAGIRGTDLWGKAADGREFVVLIEGNIAVRRGDGPEVPMTQPLSVFQATRDMTTPPLGVVTVPELTAYAAETEIAAGTGAATLGGRWKLDVARFDNQSEALALYDRLRSAGYPAVIRPVAAGSSTLYRVRIGNLPSRAEAQALGQRLEADFALTSTRPSL